MHVMNRLKRIERLEEQLRADAELNRELERLWAELCSLLTEEELDEYLRQVEAEILGSRVPHTLDT